MYLDDLKIKHSVTYEKILRKRARDSEIRNVKALTLFETLTVGLLGLNHLLLWTSISNCRVHSKQVMLLFIPVV